MSKAVKLVTIGVVLTIITTLSIASVAFASSGNGVGPEYTPGNTPDSGDNGYGPGPAPNSHDGIPDGPGWPED
ncbi:hypothetical protein ACFLXY_08305 [Chloroflexota bacterium]